MMEKDIADKPRLRIKTIKHEQVCPDISPTSSQEGLNSISRLCKGKEIHLEEVESFRECKLKPRYSSESLSRLFQDQVVGTTQKYVLKVPIEYYESLLHSSTRTYIDALGGFPVSLSCLPEVHQIYSLKQQERVLSLSETELLNRNLEFLLEAKPTAFEEYKLIKGLLDVTAGLIIQWGLFRKENYEYRRQNRVLNVQTLDLVAINAKLQSMDTFWVASAADTLPMSGLISETAKQLALVLVTVTDKLFRYMLKMNATDFRGVENIDNYLVSKQPKLKKYLPAEANYFSSPPIYQKLSMPKSVISKCFRPHSTRSLLQLRELLTEQEAAFRAFEETVLANFVSNE